MTETKVRKLAQMIRGAFRIANRLAMRRAVRRARELMEKKCLTSQEKKERDTLVTRMGRKGNSEEHQLLKEWAVSGELCCRPAPLTLAGAIAMGGYDEGHARQLLRALTMGLLGECGPGGEWIDQREVPAEEQYYFAALLCAENGILLQDIHCKNETLLTLVEERAARVAAFIEEQMPGMVEALKKEMEG